MEITNELVPFSLDEKNEVVVSARELHAFLGIKTEFKVWFMRMSEYGFVENEDYKRVYQKSNTLGGAQAIVDCILKIDMSKEICMLQRSDKGKQARKYFIELEKKFNSPEAILTRLLEITQNNKGNSNSQSSSSNNQTTSSSNQSSSFNDQTTNSTSQSIINQRQTPNTKSASYTITTESDLLTNLRDTAKIFGIRESLLIGWLLLNNYCYRDKKGAIKPSANMMEYFSLREFTTESGHYGLQTLINARGREVFRTLLIDEEVITEGGDVKLLN